MVYTPKLGDKVFLRSNEPDHELTVGVVSRFQDWTNGLFEATPITIVMDDNGEEWMGGCLRPYDADTHAVLEKLRPIEQWNYLVRDTDVMNQIPEKYGVKYKTFR